VGTRSDPTSPARTARAAGRVKLPSSPADVIHIEMTDPERTPDRPQDPAAMTREPA